MRKWLDARPTRWLFVMFLLCVAFWACVALVVTRTLATSAPGM